MERFRFKVGWGDCDPAQIVFYPRYFAYLNEATIHFFEQRGYSMQRMMGEMKSVGVPMVAMTSEFRESMTVGDVAEVDTTVTSVGRSSIKIRHEVLKEGRTALIVEETRVFAALDPETTRLRTLEVPPEMKAALLA